MYEHVFTPDIGLDGEGVVCKALWGSPLDGELGPRMGSIGVTSHQPAQAKVCNFHNMILTNQAVPRSKIPEGWKEKQVEQTKREGERKRCQKM